MMRFLVKNVFANAVDLEMAIGKDAKAFLPIKRRIEPVFRLDKLIALYFDLFDEFRNEYNRFYSHKQIAVPFIETIRK
jgi:hypothetical protein